MASAQISSNVSADVIWEISRANNSFLVKRSSGGGVQLSRDPMNLANKNSRKYAGYVNDKAFGIQPAEKGALTLISKKTKQLNSPAANKHEQTFGGQRSGPKVYKSIVNITTKRGYRSDLRQEAVARASALRRSNKAVKELPEKKVRGAKAKKSE